MTCEKWYISSDNLVQLLALTNAATDTLVTGATVTGAMTDVDGNGVTNATSIVFTDEGSGNYNGTIPENAAMTEGKIYTLTITVTASGLDLVIKITRIAVYKVEE